MNTIDTAREALQVKADRAFQNLLSAANCLAYDVTIRAADPISSHHDNASPQLTSRLKEKYLEANAASDAAFAELKAYQRAMA